MVHVKSRKEQAVAETLHWLVFQQQPWLCPHLPRKAVALAAVVAEVGHLAVLDAHPRLSHCFLGLTAAFLLAVGDDLRDCADV